MADARHAANESSGRENKTIAELIKVDFWNIEKETDHRPVAGAARASMSRLGSKGTDNEGRSAL
jgi:hypothetical protein